MATAPDWIPIDASLPRHPKAIHMAKLLGDPNAYLFLVALWLWASQHQGDGRISGSAPAMVVEAVCCWQGKPGALASAMVASGWLDELDGGYSIHDWEEHQALSVRLVERKRESNRKRTYRKQAVSQDVPSQSQPVPSTSLDCPRQTGITSPSLSSSQREEVQEKREPLGDRMVSAWTRVRGAAYQWTREDEQALRHLLQHGEVEVLRRWENALGFESYPRCHSVRDLARNWNAYAQVDRKADAAPQQGPRRMMGGKPLTPEQLKSMKTGGTA